MRLSDLLLAGDFAVKNISAGTLEIRFRDDPGTIQKSYQRECKMVYSHLEFSELFRVSVCLRNPECTWLCQSKEGKLAPTRCCQRRKSCEGGDADGVNSTRIRCNEDVESTMTTTSAIADAYNDKIYSTRIRLKHDYLGNGEGKSHFLTK